MSGPLLDHHRAMLKASAIPDDVARERGYWSATEPKQLARHFGQAQRRLVPALVIPTLDVRGEITFHQLRPDEPRTVDGRVRKYELPHKARMAVDVPPRVRPVLGDPKVPLVITEGARKADSAVGAGLYAVDLVGVWTWRGLNGDGGLTALADFEHIALNRVIYLAFDSDAMIKREVHAALERFAAFLRRRDADVRFVYLPTGDGGAKVGLDDYIAAGHGRDDVLALATDELRPLGGRSPGKPEVPEVDPVSLVDAVEVYQRWLHLPDPEPLFVLWGAIAANRLVGEPVWLLLVDVSGGGKTEIVRACGDLPECAHISSLTEAGLLSGTSQGERAHDATGGVLRVIGDRGVIVAKDFTSVLAMERNSRSVVLAALREVYDGDYTRQLGTDGGRTLRWSGKAGLVGGVTPEIDRQYLVMATLGQRFLLYRPADRDVKAERDTVRQAVGNVEQLDSMRSELRAAALGVFAGCSTTPREMSSAETEWLIGLSALAARGRAGVVVDRGEIVGRIQPELPTRLAMSLSGLLAGMDAVGVPRDAALVALRSTALGCVPQARRDALELLHGEGRALSTRDVAMAMRQSTKAARRTLVELLLHGLVDRSSAGQAHADHWSLTDWCRERLGDAHTPGHTRTGIPREREVAFPSDPNDGDTTAHDDGNGDLCTSRDDGENRGEARTPEISEDDGWGPRRPEETQPDWWPS